MVNYSNGKIYVIRPLAEYDEGEVYIGSTTKYYLADRLFVHRKMYEQYKIGRGSGRYAVYDIFDKYGDDNCGIFLVERFHAASKDELHAREGFHIRNTKCVNKYIAGGLTRDERNEKKKQYRINNAEKVKEYNDKMKEKCECECGGKYTLNNKSHHERTKKHLEFIKP